MRRTEGNPRLLSAATSIGERIAARYDQGATVYLSAERDTLLPALRVVADALRRTLAEHGHQAARVDLAVHGTCAGCREDGSAHHS